MERSYFPALRGLFGDWAYYSCVMTLAEVKKRVSFAKELHKNTALSALIQRKLKEGRSTEIANYLRTHEDRFFNSLVVAVYGGDPAWHELGDIASQSPEFDIKSVSESAIASIGFLSFTGDEELFALDGQHRLAGIKEAVSDADDELARDEVSVIFVSHHNDEAGMRRTRQLFTTLNKTARPVNKSEIIALDEADVMAITARDLVENHPYFTDKKLLVGTTPNLPGNDESHLTTIHNLYDILTTLFTKIYQSKSPKELQFNRPLDTELAAYKEYATSYFQGVAAAFPELKEYFDSEDPTVVVKKYRHDGGGSLLFRPVGLTILTAVVEEIVKTRKISMQDALAVVASIPTDLSKSPYADLLWNTSAGTIDLRRQALVRKLLLYMLGITTSARRIQQLRVDYARARSLELEQTSLPPKIE